MVTFSMSVTPL